MADPKLNIEITAKLDNLDRDFSRVTSMASDTARKVESSFGNIGGALKASLAGLAASFGVSYFSSIVRGTIDLQDHINDLSKSTSISVENLAGLGSLARKSGSDLDGLASAINKLSVNMGKDPEKYRLLGVTAKEPIEAFKQLADVFVAIKDPEQRAAVMAEAIGKAWAGAAPALSEGGKAIGEIVDKGTKLSKITSDSAKAADELNDRLSDLKTASDGAKTALVNLMVPTLTDMATKMEKATAAGHPFIAMLNALDQAWKLPWDAMLGNVDMSPAGYLKDLQQQLLDLEGTKKTIEAAGGDGWLTKLLYGTSADVDKKIQITKNQIEAFQKFGDRLGKPPAAAAPTSDANPDVSGFLGKDKTAKPAAEQISAGERLIQQLQDQLDAMEHLSEVEKYEKQIMEGRVKGITDGETVIIMQLAAEKDARTAITKELDAELLMVKEITKQYDAQDARLKTLVAGTDIGKNTQNMLDEALAESALLKYGDTFKSTYDQIIAKLHEVKDEGKDTFKELQDTIDQWGMKSAEAFTDFVFGAKASFSDLAQSVLKDIMTMVIKQNVTAPAAKAIGDWAKANLFSNADGGAYASPGLSAYSGTVVSRPTFFPFSNGIGLMGEAGGDGEGIFPLKRGKDGKLGVAASGGRGITINSNPVIHIDSRSDQAQVQLLVAKAVRAGNAQMINDMQIAGVI